MNQCAPVTGDRGAPAGRQADGSRRTGNVRLPTQVKEENMNSDKQFVQRLGTATKDAVLAHLKPVNSEIIQLKAKTERLEGVLEKAVEQQEHLIEVIDGLLDKLS